MLDTQAIFDPLRSAQILGVDGPTCRGLELAKTWPKLAKNEPFQLRNLSVRTIPDTFVWCFGPPVMKMIDH